MVRETISVIIEQTKNYNIQNCLEKIESITEIEYSANYKLEFIFLINSDIEESIFANLSKVANILIIRNKDRAYAIERSLQLANGDFIVLTQGEENIKKEILEKVKDINNENYRKIKFFKVKFRNIIANPLKMITFMYIAKKEKNPYLHLNVRDFVLDRNIINSSGSNFTSTIIDLIENYKENNIDLEMSSEKINVKNVNEKRWEILLLHSNLPLMFLKITLRLQIIIFLGASINAIFVKIFKTNIFLTPVVQVPGWTTLVLLITAGFTLMSISLIILLKLFYIVIHDLLKNEVTKKKQYR
jgi:hypothetical protein